MDNDTEDRRGQLRRPLVAKAHIVGPGGMLIPCTLQNVSEGGAMLGFDRPFQLPGKFTFQVPGNVTVTRQCELRWQDGLLAGVRFLSATGKPRRTPLAA